MGKDGKIEATCTVKNTGSVAGSETVQLYVARPRRFACPSGKGIERLREDIFAAGREP